MKIFLASNPSQKRILDLCKAPHRLISYDALRRKGKSTTEGKSSKTVVAVNGLKSKRKRKTKPKSRPQGFGLA